MCGIVGYVGQNNAVPALIEGLAKLEYRGYDSAGIALHTGEHIDVYKKTGKLENLRKLIDGHHLQSTIGIGHTRWATHGGVTDNNAHPHLDSSGEIALIHNGIFENYLPIKKELIQAGRNFKSETDSEVLVQFISAEYQNLKTTQGASEETFTQAVRTALQQVEGGYAIVCYHQNFPNLMIAARMHNPLIVGIGEGENLVASDVPALLEYTKEVYNLNNGELAILKPNKVSILNLQGKSLPLKTRTVDWDIQQAEKGGYPHFMIKEIHETPDIIQQVLAGRLHDHQLQGETLGLDGIDWSNINKVTFLACGSAAYACEYGKYLLERWGRITCEVWYGSEYRYHEPVIDKHTLVIALSQSGETADTLASIERAKASNPARIVGVINAIGSSMTREVDRVCPLQAGPEISVASTKALSSMLVSVALIALFVGQERKTISLSDKERLVSQLKAIPDHMREILKTEENVARISTFYIHHHSAYYIGRDVNVPSAREGAQKLKEISYIHAEAYPAGELKHGPNAVIHDGFPIICLIPQSSVYRKMYSNIQEMRARDANILAIATAGDQEIEDIAQHVLYHPATDESFSVLLNTLVQQLFAYYVTLYKGYGIDNPRALEKSYPMPGEITEPPQSIDIDKPRNLAKSVTVE